MENKEPNPVYSNIINLKLTPNELVLDFGAHFPDSPPKPGEKIEFTPAARIIMPTASLEAIHAALGQAIKQKQELLAKFATQAASQAAAKAQ
jgi:hypothetical protein